MPFRFLSGAWSLDEIIWNDNLEVIEERAISFFECLQTLELPETLTTLEDKAIYSCYGLESVYVPESVTSIGEHAIGYMEAYDFETDTVYDIKCENFTIIGHEGSAAQAYAEENGIAFEVAPEIILGDVDLNGDISIVDATHIQRHLARITLLSSRQLKAADTDKNGSVTVVDATMIQRFVAGIISQF